MGSWHKEQLLFVLGYFFILFVLAASISISNFKEVHRVYQLLMLPKMEVKVGFHTTPHSNITLTMSSDLVLGNR